MKKTLVSLLALSGVASATTVITFGGIDAEYSFVTDAYTLHGNGTSSGLSKTLTDGHSFTLTGSGGNFWSTSENGYINGTWSNTAALNDLNTTLGVAYTAADFSSGSKMYAIADSHAGSGTALTFNFSEAVIGNTITMYAMVTARTGALTGFTVTGLENQTVTYATNSGNGFSDTAVFSANERELTMVKITGVITEDSLVLTPAAGKKSGFQSVAYQIIPEPATATLSLLALCGLAARRRRSSL